MGAPQDPYLIERMNEDQQCDYPGCKKQRMTKMASVFCKKHRDLVKKDNEAKAPKMDLEKYRDYFKTNEYDPKLIGKIIYRFNTMDGTEGQRMMKLANEYCVGMQTIRRWVK